MTQTIQIETPQAMFDAGKAVSERTQRCLLTGELGVGKTTFVKGFAAGLGISPDQVTSPTYTYIQRYDQTLLHIDMRRVESAEQAHQIGIYDALDTYDHIIIERPKFLEDYIDASWMQVDIEKGEGEVRKIKIN